MNIHLQKLADEVAETLLEQQRQIVFAESCTSGRLASTLGTFPGISASLCGSAVAYQNETKAAWLGIPDEILNDPGPVSDDVARLMVKGVLKTTPHADVAMSVTGHLGPTDDPLDGVIYFGFGNRETKSIQVTKLELKRDDSTGMTPRELRLARQDRVVEEAFKLLRRAIAP